MQKEHSKRKSEMRNMVSGPDWPIPWWLWGPCSRNQTYTCRLQKNRTESNLTQFEFEFEPSRFDSKQGLELKKVFKFDLVQFELFRSGSLIVRIEANQKRIGRVRGFKWSRINFEQSQTKFESSQTNFEPNQTQLEFEPSWSDSFQNKL